MERLMNVEIKFAKKVKDGESEYGPWTLWNFTITEPEWDGTWFSWFSGGDKPIPAVGMKLDMLEYEFVQKDGYDNYNAKKLIVAGDETSNPKPNPKPTPQGPKQASQSTNGGQAYINHGECVVSLLKLSSSPTGKIDRPAYEKLLNAFKFGIRVLTTEAAPAAPKDKPKPEEPIVIPDEPIDDVPF